MKIGMLAAALLISSAALCQSASTPTPEAVVVPSGKLRLKGFLWKPAGPGPAPAVLFIHGSGSTDAAHTGDLAITEAAKVLAAVFLKHGYAFLYLFRRGQGLSADQGPFMQELLAKERAARGEEARRRLQFTLLTTDHLEDVLAGLAFMKTLAAVDAHRIALAGHSFGGQLTLLAAERDSTVRAAVSFGGAAASWEESSRIRDLLLTAVRRTTAPIMLIHAANDYSTEPGKALDAELSRLHKPHVLKIYPPFGKTADDGHMFVYTGVAEWERDVFAFLDQSVRDPGGNPPGSPRNPTKTRSSRSRGRVRESRVICPWLPASARPSVTGDGPVAALTGGT